MMRDSGISKAMSPMLRSSDATAPLPASLKSKLRNINTHDNCDALDPKKNLDMQKKMKET